MIIRFRFRLPGIQFRLRSTHSIKTLLGEKDIHNDTSNDKLIVSPQTECGIKLLPDFNEEKGTKDDHFEYQLRFMFQNN